MDKSGKEILNNGILDDFGLFDSPLTLEEAKKIYRSTRPLKELFPR